jgi:predicted amidophosphoribosyltransferase
VDDETHRFRGPIGKSSYWELPNRGYEWDAGITLGPYKIGDDRTITTLGQKIRDYKYWNLEAEELETLAQDLTQRALKALQERFENPPFSYLVAVPPHDTSRPSLPRYVCRGIAAKYRDRFADMSHAIRTIHKLDSVKGVSKSSRADYLKGAWGVNPKVFPKPGGGSGVLIVDDVYDTGSTMREMSRTLRQEFGKDVPQYVLTLSHVETRDWNQP